VHSQKVIGARIGRHLYLRTTSRGGISGRPKLVRYYRGARFGSCVVVTGSKEVDQLYCLLSFLQMGYNILFGALNFINDGREIETNLWLSIRDPSDGPTVTSCKDAGAGNGLTPITVDPLNPSNETLTRKGNKLIVSLEYKMVTRAALAMACARLASGKFTDAEITIREARRLPDDQVELRDDEVTIKPVWLVFTPPFKKPKLSLTKP
jgi:hypothetical protein